jgi:hypothetical protein
MSEAGLIAFGRCWSCRRSFTFHPDLVPSLPVDPETNLPLDVDGEGNPREFSVEDYRRSVKVPICSACIGLANRQRERHGRPPIAVLPGAYGPGHE